MHDHAPTSIERHCDVAIVGGSAAGLAAALQLSRQRRSVIVIDAGDPRNAPAAHLHGYLGREGMAPSELTAVGRDEVRGYGGEVLDGHVEDIARLDGGGFRLVLRGGHVVVARRALAATGLVDELPAIDGVAEHWGHDVIHCPFCHGYEVRDQRVVQIVTHPMGLHPAPLFRQLTDDLTVVVHEPLEADLPELAALAEAGVPIVDQRVRRLVTGTDGRLAGVELGDGRVLAADTVVVGPRFRPRLEPFAALAPAVVAHPSGLGDVVEVDPTGQTSVPGLYAAGNVADPSQQLLHAAADGSRTGAMISFSLAHEDLAAAARPSANQADWDHRYAGEPLWSGNPNGSLVREATGLPPGRALDVGAGEGGDAIWLAEQGWQVVASDITANALRRVAAEAERRGLDVTCLLADANAAAPFEPDRFDLVTASYASFPRTPDDRGIANLLAAVAPGGTLVVIGHDLAPMRAATGPEQARPFDPDAYVGPDAFAAVLTDLPGWDLEVHEARPRPPGAATAAHHVDDIVLRARRHAR